MNNIYKYMLIVCLAGAVVFFVAKPNVLPAMSSGVSTETVKQVQQKLNELGYDAGTPDGVAGAKTREAVTAFQRDKGLTADGIIGKQTLNALGIGTGEPAQNYTEAEIDLLTRIINGEARGESFEGQVAVGAVVLNRVASPSFPDTIEGVIYQPDAFTAVTDKQIEAEIYESARRAAIAALNGQDPTGGAVYYYNPAKTTNKWIYSRPVITRIQNHVFAM